MRIGLGLIVASAIVAAASSAIAKPAPQPIDPDVGQFVWLIEPDFMKVQLTIQEYVGRREGSALIECTMRNGRTKDCKVVEETPGGNNHGQLAIAIARLYKAASKDSLGQPIEGRVIRMPVVVKRDR